VQQARLGELEGAGADGGDPLAVGGGRTDGRHDPGLRLERGAGARDDHRVRLPHGVEAVAYVQVETAGGGDRARVRGADEHLVARPAVHLHLAEQHLGDGDVEHRHR
jgi:hypothetical protein